MVEPHSSRPHMPEYGISKSAEGMLPWSWAEERLAETRNYWVSTVSAHSDGKAGRPHSTAVWGVWHEGRFYFSMAASSLKARNLALNPHIVVTTEGAGEAVILEGTFEGMAPEAAQPQVREEYKAKYDWDTVGYDFYAVRPVVVFGFVEAADKFATAATRWRWE